MYMCDLPQYINITQTKHECSALHVCCNLLLADRALNAYVIYNDDESWYFSLLIALLLLLAVSHCISRQVYNSLHAHFFQLLVARATGLRTAECRSCARAVCERCVLRETQRSEEGREISTKDRSRDLTAKHSKDIRAGMKPNFCHCVNAETFPSAS